MRKVKGKLLCILSVFLILSLFFAAVNLRGGGLSADAADTVTWSNEQYYRMLHLNNLEADNARSYSSEQLDFSNYDDVTYIKQGSNMWSYLSIGLSVASAAFSALPAANGVARVVGLLSKGTKVGANWALRESVLEKIAESNAGMLNETMREISEDFSKLSGQIEEQTSILRSSIQASNTILYNKIGMESYKTALNSFYNTAFVNGSSNGLCGYYDWFDALKLRFDSISSAPPADSKLLYDDLYVLSERVNTLYNYIVGNQNAVDDSILEILFNYCLLASTEKIDGFNVDEALYDCIQFGEELYSAYLYANACLQFAYSYQALNMGGGTVYALSNGTIVSLNNILGYFDNLPTRIANVENELSRFYARVLDLDGIYTVQANGMVGRVCYDQISANALAGSRQISIATGPTSHYAITHDRVPQGSVLYFENLPEILTASMTGEFSFESSAPSLAEVSENGVVTVNGTQGSFDISLKRDGDVIYTMHFEIGKEAFSGGFGTEDLPYFISNGSDMQTLAGNSGYWGAELHYLLVSDLMVEGFSFSRIGNDATPFSGTFDGGCHQISRRSGEALFGTVRGTVKNLRLSDITVTGYVLKNNNQFFGGILCIENRGTLDNCHVANSSVSASLYAATTGSSYYLSDYLYFGMVGVNYGTMENCSATGVKVRTNFDSQIGSSLCYPDIYCYEGGLVGSAESGGVVRDCLASGGEVYSYLKNRSTVGAFNSDKRESTAHFYLGGLIGSNSGTADRCAAVKVNVHYDWTGDVDNTSGLWPGSATAYKDPHTDALCAVRDGSVKDCYTSLAGASSAVQQTFKDNGWDLSDLSSPVLKQSFSSEECAAKGIRLNKPAQTVYNVGDPLNLAGLAVFTDRGTELYRYRVDAPDMDQKGEKTVNISWNGFSASFGIEVRCPHKEFTLEEEILESGCTGVMKRVKHFCKACNELVYTSTELDSKQGTHTFGQGVVSVEPTYESEGLIKYTCTVCGFTKTETVPKLIRRTVTLSGGKVKQGGTITVGVTLCGNPDISAASLKVEYDPAALELVSAEDTGLLKGGAFSSAMGSPYYLTWENNTGAPNSEDGVIARLTFRARENYEGETDVRISAAEGILDQKLKEVVFEYTNAAINVGRELPGDVNGDGEVDSGDVALLRRYLAFREEYRSLDVSLADVNGDGKVDASDVAVLRRYLSGWEGYVPGGMPPAGAGAQGGEIAVEGKTASAGEEIALTVTLGNNPGIVSAYLGLDYDRERLVLERVEDGGLLTGFMATDSYGAEKFHLTWDGSLGTRDVTASGILVTLVFKVKENAPAGTAAVSLYDAYGILDSELDRVGFVFAAGGVEVSEAQKNPAQSGGQEDQSGQDGQDGQKEYGCFGVIGGGSAAAILFCLAAAGFALRRRKK